MIGGHRTHPGWHSWFSGRSERGSLVFWFEGRLSITWRRMSSVELVGEGGVMHTLFRKVPSMGSWTFQFNLYMPPRKARHLHSIFSKAVRTPPQCSQPHRLFPAAERPVPAPCRNSTDTIEGGGMDRVFMASGRSPRKVCFQPLRKQRAKQTCRLSHIVVNLSTCFTSREGLWSG